MFSEFSLMKNSFDDSKMLLLKYLEANRVNKLESDLNQKMALNKPVVMVYGVYNAGKSSLINALVGSVVAEEGDVPKTDKVDSYQYNNFKILDTPGIDAPIEHEDVSREQLIKSDAILFVLSSDGVFDEKLTFDEVYNIVEAGKPVLVVINNKSGYKETDKEYHSIVEKFKVNLTKFADDKIKNHVAAIPVLLINAKAALKAKQEGKCNLLARSNIVVLEKEVQRLFHLSDKKQQLVTMKNMLSHELGAARDKAESMLSDSDAKNITKLLERISNNKQVLIGRVNKYIALEKGCLCSNVLALLVDGQGSQVSSCLESWQSKFNNYFVEQLSKTIAQVGVDADSLVSHIPAFNASTPLEGELIVSGENKSSVLDLNQLISLGKQIKVSDQVMKQGIIKSLEMGKSFFPGLFKGIGPVTMRKYAERMIPFVGPFISIVTGIYDYFKAKREEERLVAQEKNRVERIKEYAERLVNDVTENVADIVGDEVESYFLPVVNKLEDQLDKTSEQQKVISDDVKRLLSINERIMTIL